MQLKFQPNGPSECQLNFPHGSLASSRYPPGENAYEFTVKIDAVFNAETMLSRTGTVGGSVEGSAEGNVGLAKAGVKTTVNGSYEMGKQYPDTRVTLHGTITGRLNARSHRPDLRLTAIGHIYGSPSLRRTK